MIIAHYESSFEIEVCLQQVYDFVHFIFKYIIERKKYQVFFWHKTKIEYIVYVIVHKFHGVKIK